MPARPPVLSKTPPVGFDVRVVGRGSSGNLWREHRLCLGFWGGGVDSNLSRAVKPDEASP